MATMYRKEPYGKVPIPLHEPDKFRLSICNFQFVPASEIPRFMVPMRVQKQVEASQEPAKFQVASFEFQIRSIRHSTLGIRNLHGSSPLGSSKRNRPLPRNQPHGKGDHGEKKIHCSPPAPWSPFPWGNFCGSWSQCIPRVCHGSWHEDLPAGGTRLLVTSGKVRCQGLVFRVEFRFTTEQSQ